MILIWEDLEWWINSKLIENTLKIEIDNLIKQGFKMENIIQKNINSVSGLNESLNSAYIFGYSGIIWMFHGDPYSISITSKEVINIDTLKQLTVPSDFDIPIRLDSCNTWEKTFFGNDSIWEEFARKIWTQLTAPDWYVAPDVKRDALWVWSQTYAYRQLNGFNEWLPSWVIIWEGQWNTYNY